MGTPSARPRSEACAVKPESAFCHSESALCLSAIFNVVCPLSLIFLIIIVNTIWGEGGQHLRLCVPLLYYDIMNEDDIIMSSNNNITPPIFTCIPQI